MVKGDIQDVSRIVCMGYKFLADKEGYTNKQLACLIAERSSKECIRKWLVKYKCFVADDTKKIVGVIAVSKNDVAELWILTRHHGQGVGTALFKKAEQYIAGKGYNKLTIRTTGNATGFYEIMGAKVVGYKKCPCGPLRGRMLTFLEKPFRNTKK